MGVEETTAADESMEPKDPLLSCLPRDLRGKLPKDSDQKKLIENCFNLRQGFGDEKTESSTYWPNLNLIGGGDNGAPTAENLRDLSERLLMRLAERATKEPAPGLDPVALFVATNDLSARSEREIRKMPETARLRVIRAGPVVGFNKDATLMHRMRRAMKGLDDADAVPDARTFLTDNWVSTQAERMFRQAPPDVQLKVMQKGPLLGPCPQRELTERVERAEKQANEAAEKAAEDAAAKVQDAAAVQPAAAQQQACFPQASAPMAGFPTAYPMGAMGFPGQCVGGAAMGMSPQSMPMMFNQGLLQMAAWQQGMLQQAAAQSMARQM